MRVNRATFASSVVAIAVVVVGSGAGEAHALWCQQRLVSIGDSPFRVRTLCGEPASVATRVEQRSVDTVRRIDGAQVVVVESHTVTVAVEEWVYDFGPERLTRRLVFENGVLRSVQTGRYGIGPSRTARVEPPGREEGPRWFGRRRSSSWPA